ncbi:MAG: alpha/beta hydrolase [Clostridia bacterium]|nr:alpha/beta hydrolase [Clostridia bacterium]
MKNYTVDLAKEYGLQGKATLDCILSETPWDSAEIQWKRPALVVVPGGGYGMVSRREADPVAFAFLPKGFQTFVLNYTIGGENGMSYPQQLMEAAAAVDYVKKHASECNVNPDEVFIVGFSAGGHLVGNLCVEYASVSQKMGKELDCKPTAAALAYPVISQIHGHQGSYNNLLYGYTDEAKAELLKTLNLDQAVTENTPPAFIWTTATDNAVPADNALRYAMALDRNGVSYELHVYPDGWHGTSTGMAEVNGEGDFFHRIQPWVDNCVEFFKRYVSERI